MENNYNLNEEEKLKAENDFLKMKIMLENGVDFCNPVEQHEPDLQLENEFLKYIIEFEKQARLGKIISVFDKIGRPQHFKPVCDVPDAAIEEEWKKLSEYMQQYGFDIGACSPKVSARELYRFTTEEVFKYETCDVTAPNVVSTIIYDDVYPDDEYDNTRFAIECCIKLILRKKPMELATWFTKENIQLNTHTGLTEQKLKDVVNKFKDRLDNIELNKTNNVTCMLQEKNCKVTGTHETTLVFDNIPVTVKGNWLVEFIRDDDFWNIANVQIEAINI